jgi:hypothetical protein
MPRPWHPANGPGTWSRMNYKNTEITVDTLISELNQGKIRLNPPFQRPSVWNLKARQRLIKNMLLERPIPALFLFKRGEDIKTVSYVLDGKQRLESLILYVSDKRKNAQIKQPKSYFFKKPNVLKTLGYEVQIDKAEDAVDFASLDQDLARKFLTYRIAVIEVDFPDDDSEQVSMYDVIQLFIDINETGKKVNRLQIVSALNASINSDELFKSLQRLIGIAEQRQGGRSLFKRPISSDYTFVLKRLRDVASAPDSQQQVDIMWERLHEIALFAKTGTHRAPSEVLKGIIAGARNKKLTGEEQRRLKRVFKFIATAYRKNPAFQASKFATDQPQFYTMVTTLLSSDLLDKIDEDTLISALADFADYANKLREAPTDDIQTYSNNYINATGKQTTHTSKRRNRHDALVAGVTQIVALGDGAAV